MVCKINCIYSLDELFIIGRNINSMEYNTIAGLALTNQHIYWSDWKTNALHMLDRRNTTGPQIVRGNLEGLMDVKVIKKEEKRMENVCGHNNGNCSHLCLRNPKGFSCQCPIGTKLTSQTECSTLPEVSDFKMSYVNRLFDH